MATIADALRVTLKLDTSDLSQGLQRVKSDMASIDRELASTLREASQVVVELTKAIQNAATAMKDFVGNTKNLERLEQGLRTIREDLAGISTTLKEQNNLGTAFAVGVGSSLAGSAISVILRDLYKSLQSVLPGLLLAARAKISSFIELLGPGLKKGASIAGVALKLLGRGLFLVLKYSGMMAVGILLELQKSIGTLGGVIMRTLPAIVSFGAALLANPITWVIGLVAALVFAVYDLYKYLSGGDSMLSGLWSTLGSNFSDFGDNIKGIFTNIYKFIDSLFSGNFSEAANALIDNFINANMSLVNFFGELASTIGDAFIWVFNLVGIDIKAIFQSIFDWFCEKIAALKDILPDMSGTIQIAMDAGTSLKEWGSNALDTVGGYFPGAQSPAPAALAAANGISHLNSSIVNNSSVATLNGGVNIHTQATDARGIADSFGDHLGRQLAFVANRRVKLW